MNILDHGGTITKEAIDKLSVKQIDIFDGLIYNKEPIQKILVTLYNHFKKLYLCSLAIKLNKNIIDSLGLKPNQTFLVNKYKKQLSFFKEEELKNILEEFTNLDYNSKNGKIDVEIGLRSILCSYC